MSYFNITLGKCHPDTPANTFNNAADDTRQQTESKEKTTNINKNENETLPVRTKHTKVSSPFKGKKKHFFYFIGAFVLRAKVCCLV